MSHQLDLKIVAEAIQHLDDKHLFIHKTDQIDWFRILADLNKIGLKCHQIARRLSCGKSTVAGWKEGRTPMITHAFKLLQLHHMLIK